MPLSIPRKRFYIFISLITIIGWGWLILQYYRPSASTVCLIKNVTGYPCPSCGTTRASIAVLQGKWATAIDHNLLGFFAIVMLVLIPLWLMKDYLQKQDSLYTHYTKTINTLKQKKAVFVILLLLITINWVWNLLKTT